MKKTLIAFICVFFLISISNCASITRGSIEGTRSILVTSSPVGAEVYHRDQLLCITPCKIQVQNWNLKDPIIFKSAGYEPVQIKATDGVSGGTYGNLIFGGLLGVGIDVLNGSAKRNKESIHIEFEKRLGQ